MAFYHFSFEKISLIFNTVSRLPALNQNRLFFTGIISSFLSTIVAVTGSLILMYTLWSALVLVDGASGKWVVMHPSAMAFVAVTVTSFIGLVAGVARTTSDANQMDILTAPAVMLLVLISYYRLKDEGMEDGMTFMGEPAEGSLFTNAVLMLALIVGLLTTINEIILA